MPTNGDSTIKNPSKTVSGQTFEWGIINKGGSDNKLSFCRFNSAGVQIDQSVLDLFDDGSVKINGTLKFKSIYIIYTNIKNNIV